MVARYDGFQWIMLIFNTSSGFPQGKRVKNRTQAMKYELWYNNRRWLDR